MKTEEEILTSLSLIPVNMVIAVDEADYLPIGQITAEAAKHIQFLREQINILEAWRYGG